MNVAAKGRARSSACRISHRGWGTKLSFSLLSTLSLLSVLAGCRRAEASPKIEGPDVLVLELGGEQPRLADLLKRAARAAPTPAADPVKLQPAHPSRPAALLPQSTVPRTVVLREGESLGQLAQRALGTATRWKEIAELNNIEDETRLAPGTTLRLPFE